METSMSLTKLRFPNPFQKKKNNYLNNWLNFDDMKMENYIAVNELCSHYSIEETFISQLDDIGLLEVTPIGKQLHIEEEAIHRFEKIMRLHRDLEINPEGIDVVLRLLDKMDSLEAEIQTLRNRLKIFEEF